MKKVFLCAIMAMSTVGLFAQVENIKKAKKLASSGENPDFALAIQTIDEAIKGTEANNVEAWYTKGEIYLKQYTFEDDKRFLIPPMTPDVNVQSNAAYGLYQTWIIADSLDVLESQNNPKRKGKLKYRSKMAKEIFRLKDFVSNYGVIKFQDGNYAEATEAFDQLLNMPNLPMFKEEGKVNATDSVFFYAKENDQVALRELYRQQFEKGDTLAAEKTLKVGNKKYPTNAFFLTYMIQHDIWANRKAEAMNNLNRAIEMSPNEIVFYLVRGNILSLDKTQRAVARNDYNKALEIKPDFFEAVYALADLSKNEGDDHYNNFIDWEMKRPADAKAEKELADKCYKEAIATYEKARTMKKDVDDALLQNLQGLYRKLKMYDKEKEIRAARGL